MFDKIHSLLVLSAPKAFRIPAKWVPPVFQQTLMLETLKRVFHEAIDEGEFSFLEGRWLEVHVRDVDVKHYISFAEDKLIVSTDPKPSDVSFSGDLNDLILIAARKEDPDTLFFQRRLLIEGDTELGLEVKNLMDSVDLDAMPKVLRQGLLSLAEFIQKGLEKSAALSEGRFDAHQI